MCLLVPQHISYRSAVDHAPSVACTGPLGGPPRPTRTFAAGGACVSTYRAAPAHVWASTMLDLLVLEQVSPLAAARIFAGGAVAMYEAALPGMPGRRRLTGTVGGLDAAPSAEARRGLDWPAAVSAGAYTVLVELLALQAPGAAPLLRATFDWQLLARRSSRSADHVVAASLRWGEQVGAAVVEWARADAEAAPGGPGAPSRQSAAAVTRLLQTTAASLESQDLRLDQALEAYAVYALAVHASLRSGNPLPRAA